MAKKRTDLIYTVLGYIVILAILVVVALIMGGGAYLLLINGIRPSVDSLHKWIGLTVSTLVTFVFAIKELRRHWHNKLFWTALTGLLIVHLACFLALFNFIQHWTVVWFFLICTFEIPLIIFLADRIVSREKRRVL